MNFHEWKSEVSDTLAIAQSSVDIEQISNEELSQAYEIGVSPLVFANTVSLRQRTETEKVAVDNPAEILSRKNKAHPYNKALLIVLALILIFYCASHLLNYFLLDRPLQNALAADERNKAISVSAHYPFYLPGNTCIYSVDSISAESSRIDVIRTLLVFAETEKDHKFDKVFLASQGVAKYFLTGDYFQKLGQNYTDGLSVMALGEIPRNVKNLDGTEAFPAWTGGWIGVAGKQMEDLTTFSDKWFLSDQQKIATDHN